MPVTVFATLPFTPDHVDEAARVIAGKLPAIRREPGCRDYAAATANDGSGRVFTFERWTDDAALDAHLARAETKAMLDEVGGWLSGEVEIVRTSELEG